MTAVKPHLIGELCQLEARRSFAAIEQQQIGLVARNEADRAVNLIRYASKPARRMGSQASARAIHGEHRADAFAIAQALCQRHHAFHMAVAERAAAVAADEREPAFAGDVLLAHMGVDLAQRGSRSSSSSRSASEASPAFA